MYLNKVERVGANKVTDPSPRSPFKHDERCDVSTAPSSQLI